jgi:GTP cyclohydrolase IA
LSKTTTAELVKHLQVSRKPSRAQAEEAVRTLIAWAGDDPEREGLKDTPRRVVEAYEEYFRGYAQDPVAILQDPAFEDVAGYNDMVLMRDIRVTSHCEHHIAPFIGLAHVAYVPRTRVAGLSKLARVVEVFARRLQTQEAMTAQIAETIVDALDAAGVAVMIESEHHCVTTRGVGHAGVTAVTTRFLGSFASDASQRQRFLALVEAPRRKA